MTDRETPRVTVERSLPTDPGVRGSASLYLTEAERQGVTASRRMLHVGMEPCPERVAASLAVAPGERVLARRKLMLAEDVPVRIATSYFPATLGEGPLATPDFIPGGLQGALEQLGHRFGGADEELTARMPTPYEAEALDLGPGTPVVCVLRGSYDVDAHPVHALETICAADRHVFRIRQVTGTDTF